MSIVRKAISLNIIYFGVFFLVVASLRVDYFLSLSWDGFFFGMLSFGTRMWLNYMHSSIFLEKCDQILRATYFYFKILSLAMIFACSFISLIFQASYFLLFKCCALFFYIGWIIWVLRYISSEHLHLSNLKRFFFSISFFLSRVRV